MITLSRRIAPWYVAYLILGLLTSGLLPFLLPLLIVDVSHQLGTVGYVTGAYNLGLLPAPLFGRLAERAHLHRPLFFGAFAVLALAFGALPHVSGVGPWFVLALSIGIATGAAATIATLFIVDFTPRTEWEPRIGWLQSFNGAGQLAGLLIGGAFAQGGFATGFGVAALLAVAAIVVGHIGLPADGSHRVRDAALGHLSLLPLLRPPQLGPSLDGLLHHSHHLQWAGLSVLRTALRGPFGHVLLAWAAYSFGVAAFFAYYPLMLRHSYGVPPELTAIVYAIAAGVGVFLYLLAGRLSARFGGRRVFRAGVAVRILGFGLLGIPFLATPPHVECIALIGFVLVVLAWPVMSVSGTTLAARLAPIGEGAAIGLLSAAGALATVLGTFAGGPLVRYLGYWVVPVLAILGLGLAEAALGHRPRGLNAATARHDPGRSR